MKLTTICVALAAGLAFSAGSALAQMQPIPNPPEKPAAAKHHGKHKAKHHAAAKKTDASAAKAAPAAKP